jgi:hypothetical protein
MENVGAGMTKGCGGEIMCSFEGEHFDCYFVWLLLFVVNKLMTKKIVLRWLNERTWVSFGVRSGLYRHI